MACNDRHVLVIEDWNIKRKGLMLSATAAIDSIIMSINGFHPLFEFVDQNLSDFHETPSLKIVGADQTDNKPANSFGLPPGFDRQPLRCSPSPRRCVPARSHPLVADGKPVGRISSAGQAVATAWDLRE